MPYPIRHYFHGFFGGLDLSLSWLYTLRIPAYCQAYRKVFLVFLEDIFKAKPDKSTAPKKQEKPRFGIGQNARNLEKHKSEKNRNY